MIRSSGSHASGACIPRVPLTILVKVKNPSSGWYIKISSMYVDQTYQRASQLEATPPPLPPVTDPVMAVSVPPPSALTILSICARCQDLREWVKDPASHCRDTLKVKAASLGQSDCQVCQIFWASSEQSFPKYHCPSSITVEFRVEHGQLSMSFHKNI